MFKQPGKLWDNIMWSSSNNSFTLSVFVRDSVSTVGLVLKGGLTIQHGDSVGELAQAHCHCWQGKEGRGGGTECESQCDWFQIDEKGEGPSFVWL